MRLKEALAQANGWQRIWMVIAALWILVVLTAGYRAWPQSVRTVTDFSISPEAVQPQRPPLPLSDPGPGMEWRLYTNAEGQSAWGRVPVEDRPGSTEQSPPGTSRTLTRREKLEAEGFEEVDPNTFEPIKDVRARTLRNQRAMFAGGVLMASVIPPAFLYFLGWGTSQVRRRRLNGWQRIFAVTAGVWTLVCGLSTLVFLIPVVFIGRPDGIPLSLGEVLYSVGAALGFGLLFAVIPLALLYAVGYAVAWIRRGFQDTSK